MKWLVLLMAVAVAGGFGKLVKVAVLSDLHLNLQSTGSCFSGHSDGGNSTTPHLWCDSPLELIRSALHKLAELQTCYPMIMIPGDILRHRYSGTLTAEDALATFSTLQNEVDKVFGHCNGTDSSTPVIAIGNNDLLERYPAPAAEGKSDPWLSQIGDSWQVTQALDAKGKTAFAHSGFYSTMRLGVKVIVLHTNYWAKKNAYVGSLPDPAGGFQWLKDELEGARNAGQKVWLLGHISPGVDHYSAAALYHPTFATAFWTVVDPFLKDDTIVGTFFGHEHAILERRQSDGEEVPRPSWLSGSVSPDKGNNPSVRLLTVDDGSKEIVDVEDWIRPLPSKKWEKLGRFSTMFGHLNIDDLLEKLRDDRLAVLYAARMNSNAATLKCDDSCVEAVVCDVGNSYLADYVECTNALGKSDWSGTLGLVGGLVGVALLFMIVLVCWKRSRVRGGGMPTSQKLVWDDEFDQYEDSITQDDLD